MKRIPWILTKWTIIGITLIALYLLKVFHLIFWLFFLFLSQISIFIDWLGTGTEMGAKDYWHEYGQYWLMAYVFLMVFLVAFHFLGYRKVRPVLKMGNRREGTIVWIKGLRRGLHYELWDVYNYLKKKKGSPLPSPLTINRGPNIKSGKCISFRSPWSLKIRYLFIPENVPLDIRYSCVHIPDGYLANRPSERMDRSDLQFIPFKNIIGYKKFDADKPLDLHKKFLKMNRKMVQDSVASNPEINQMDFTTGSFPVVGANDD